MAKPKTICIFIMLFFGVFFMAKSSKAADVTAVSCSAADIQTALNNAVASGGGTVHIPACKDGANGSYWTGTGDKVCIYTAVELHVLGAGKDATVIEYRGNGGPGSSGSCGSHTGYGKMMMEFHGSGFKEFGQVTLKGNGDLGGNATLYIHGNEGMTNVRLHDFSLNNIVQPGIYFCENVNSAAVIDHAYIGNAGPWGALTSAMDSTQTTISVADGSYFPIMSTASKPIIIEHEKIACTGKSGNTLTGCVRGASGTTAVPHAAGKIAWYYSSAYGISVVGSPYESDYVEPPAFGINNGLFIESSDFNGTYHPIAGFYATRETVRHNTFKNNMSGAESHESGFTSGCGYGTPAALPGAYRIEYYDNTFDGSDNSSSWCSYATYSRAGHYIITDNTIINCGHGHSLDVGKLSSFGPACITGSGGVCTVPRAYCNAANNCPWTNTGYATTNNCYQAINGVYIWNNTYVPSTMTKLTFEQLTECIRQDKEYFLRAPQAGDPIITSYAKFTYPHPLTVGGTTDTTPPAAPTGVTVS